MGTLEHWQFLGMFLALKAADQGSNLELPVLGHVLLAHVNSHTLGRLMPIMETFFSSF